MFSYNPFSKMNDSKCGNFASKLQSLLNNSRHSSIVCWGDKNTVIEILDEQRMEQEILPVYFKQSKYESFVRQLNLYGFKKVKSQGTSRFTHPLLLQGCPMSTISTVKNRKVKAGEFKENIEADGKKRASSSDKLVVSLQKQASIDAAVCDTLVQNRSSAIQIQNSPNGEEIASNLLYCYPPVMYFTTNPYFAWNFTQLINNSYEINKQVEQISGNTELLQS